MLKNPALQSEYLKRIFI